MTYSKKEAQKCSVRDCKETVVITIVKNRDVSGLTVDGNLFISKAHFCAQHKP